MSSDAPKKEPPMRHCFYCGEELGRYWVYDRLDNCGKRECVREASDAERAEREEAHEQLDRDRGWA
jgi:hypothetical protein